MTSTDKLELDLLLLPGETRAASGGSGEKTTLSEFLLQWRNFKSISPGMKHDSISKDLMETRLSASLPTELLHFICGTNGEK